MPAFEVYFQKLEPIGDIPAGRDVAAFAARNWVEAVHLCRTAFGIEHAPKVRITYVWERGSSPLKAAYSYLRHGGASC